MLGRRLLVFVVVLAGLAVLASLAAPREDGAAPVTRAPAPPAGGGPESPELSGQAAPPAAPALDDVPGEPPLRRIDVRRRVAPITIRVGERLRLAFADDRPSAVQVGEDGRIEPIDPASPARFDLLYSTPGRREIRLYGPGLTNERVIGAVEVSS